MSLGEWTGLCNKYPWCYWPYLDVAIVVPRGRDHFGQRQASRPLPGSNTGSPRVADLFSNLANLIGWIYKTSTLPMLKKSGPASGRDF